MDSKELDNQFQAVERNIIAKREKQEDVTDLLREKARLLSLGYKKLSDIMKNSEIKVIAPLFAKRIAFLNNIKQIKQEINEDISEIETEISNVHNEMREKGLGWILDNLPEKQ